MQKTDNKNYENSTLVKLIQIPPDLIVSYYFFSRRCCLVERQMNIDGSQPIWVARYEYECVLF